MARLLAVADEMRSPICPLPVMMSIKTPLCDGVRLDVSELSARLCERPTMATLVRLLVLLLILASLGRPAYAGESEPDHDVDDHDQARGLVEHGEIQALPDVLDAVGKTVPGDIVAIALNHRNDHWVYVLTIVTPAGQRRHVIVDASSLTILNKGGER